MTLQSSGAISLNDVRIELQNPSATVSLNDAAVRSLGGVPTGQISLSNLYGKSYGMTLTISGAIKEFNLAATVDTISWGFRKSVVVNFANDTLVWGEYLSAAFDMGAYFDRVTFTGGESVITGGGGLGGQGATAGANNGSPGTSGGIGVRTRSTPLDAGAIPIYGGGGGGGGGGGAYISKYVSTNNGGTGSSGTQYTYRSAGGGGGGGAGGSGLLLGDTISRFGGASGSGQSSGDAGSHNPQGGKMGWSFYISTSNITGTSIDYPTKVGAGGIGGYAVSGADSGVYAMGGTGGNGGLLDKHGSYGSMGIPGAAGSYGVGGERGAPGAAIAN